MSLGGKEASNLKQSCTYRPLNQNLIGTANPITTIDTHTKKKKQPKHNTKDGDQNTRQQNKRGREEKRPTKTKPELLTKQK